VNAPEERVRVQFKVPRSKVKVSMQVNWLENVRVRPWDEILERQINRQHSGTIKTARRTAS
jgi:hypothetical protein